MSRRLRSDRMRIAGAFALVTFLAMHAFAEDARPLAAAAFDKEVNAEMNGADIAEIFQRVADAVGVSFTLDFQSEADLKVSFKATNLTARALLHSLGDAYGLRYSTNVDGDVVVRREGPPPPRLVRITPSGVRPAYELHVLVRSATGEVLSTPHVTAAVNQAAEIRTGGQPAYVIKIYPKKMTADGLELLVEATERRIAEPGHTVTDEHTDTKRAGAGDTLLYKGSDGRQFILAGWVAQAGASEASQTPPVGYALRCDLRRDGHVIESQTLTTVLGQRALFGVRPRLGGGLSLDGALRITPVKEDATGLELRVEGTLGELDLDAPRGGSKEERLRRLIKWHEDVSTSAVVGTAETVLLKTDKGYELVVQWARLAVFSAATNATSVASYELKYEIRRPNGSAIEQRTVNARTGQTIRFGKIVMDGRAASPFGGHLFLSFELTPKAETPIGLCMEVSSRASGGRPSNPQISLNIAGTGETLLFRSIDGYSLVLVSWGTFEKSVDAAR
jgi:hypothetical protein